MRTKASIYAITCMLLLVGGFLLTFYFAWQSGIEETVWSIVGYLLAFVFAPTLHELGHIVFAKTAKMGVMYAKFFCFKVYLKNGKKRLAFASPFVPEETQVLPKTGGDMKERAERYTIGGLILGGLFLLLILLPAVVLSAFGSYNGILWGLVPYTAYLFLLNALPLEYRTGKTDMLVYLGIKKGYAAEKNMLAAMEIQGQLYEGKSFSLIEESLYYDLPQLPEDEPLFAVMLDLRYRYHLEKGELKKAADCLNRLASAQEYLPMKEVRKLCAELVYMHSLNGDFERAEECGSYCKTYLAGETVSAKRILAAYSAAFGKLDAVPTLKAQAEEALKTERIKGIVKFEEILLSRLPSA